MERTESIQAPRRDSLAAEPDLYAGVVEYLQACAVIRHQRGRWVRGHLRRGARLALGAVVRRLREPSSRELAAQLEPERVRGRRLALAPRHRSLLH